MRWSRIAAVALFLACDAHFQHRFDIYVHTGNAPAGGVLIVPLTRASPQRTANDGRAVVEADGFNRRPGDDPLAVYASDHRLYVVSGRDYPWEAHGCDKKESTSKIDIDLARDANVRVPLRCSPPTCSLTFPSAAPSQYRDYCTTHFVLVSPDGASARMIGTNNDTGPSDGGASVLVFQAPPQASGTLISVSECINGTAGRFVIGEP
jgi:hypothetical protein